jgi:hypothetical protein
MPIKGYRLLCVAATPPPGTLDHGAQGIVHQLAQLLRSSATMPERAVRGARRRMFHYSEGSSLLMFSAAFI